MTASIKISANDVGKKYRNAVQGVDRYAVRDLNIEIRENEFVCLLGPSGCGKSTFVNMVAGFVQATTGSLLIDGRTVVGPGPDRGVVFQDAALFPWLSALDNVAFGPRTAGASRKEARAAAQNVLEVVGLKGFERHLPRALSGGMRQRVAIARVLVNDPGIMLMDEPFSALDAFTRVSLQREVVRIWEANRRTVLFVTHNVEEALLLGTRVLIMGSSSDGGELLEDLKIDLPRPRDTTSSEFNDYKRSILATLNVGATA